MYLNDYHAYSNNSCARCNSISPLLFSYALLMGLPLRCGCYSQHYAGRRNRISTVTQPASHWESLSFVAVYRTTAIANNKVKSWMDVKHLYVSTLGVATLAQAGLRKKITKFELWLYRCCETGKKCIDTVSSMLLMTSDEILRLSVQLV